LSYRWFLPAAYANLAQSPDARRLMAGKIFVNYRRDDERAVAARVRDRLASAFGAANVFMDVDNLMAGQRFDKELEKALAGTDVFLAIIGIRWMELLAERSASGERDYVREEIAGALSRSIIVIPVLIERVALPRADALPEDIRDLVLHQKHVVTHDHFGRDMSDLVEAIRFARKSGTSTVPPPSMRATSAGLKAAGAVGAIAAAWIAAHYSGVPVPWPQQPAPGAVDDRATANVNADARRKSEAEAAQQMAMLKAEEDRKRADEEATKKRAALAAWSDRMKELKLQEVAKNYVVLKPCSDCELAAFLCNGRQGPVTSVDDLRGRKINIQGTERDILEKEIKSTGAIIILLSRSEIYDALRLGVIDCVGGRGV
jgi:TIR domain/Bacterial extracellular solute-binding protein, family 7